MKRILVCTGVLGGGTAAVFAVAALAATLAPAGQLVPGNWQQTGVMRGGPVMLGGGGMTKVIGPDGSVILQSGPNSNFGVVTVTGAVGAGNAGVDLPAIAPTVGPVTVQPAGTETP